VGAAVLMAAAGVFANETAVPAYPNFGMPRVEEMMFLVLQIGIIIFAAKLGGMLATLFKLPSILGELAAGIAIGPWALGGIGFGEGVFKYGLFNGVALRSINEAATLAGGAESTFPLFGTTAGNGALFDATSPALYGIATLASIILLFLSGLETNLKMFLKYSFVGLMVGLGGVIFSFLFGDLCAVYLLPHFFPTKFGFLASMPLGNAIMQAAPMYMGIMSTATSVGITARILSERKKMDSEEGVSIMAGAVIDDVLGLIVLAIGNGIIGATAAAAGSAKGGVPWGQIGMVAIKAFGVWLGATLVGVMVARKISWLLKLFKSPQAIATLAFGLSMILAGFFEFMGLAMIIGAYVMGLALSRTDLKNMIQETLAPVYTFLVPIFFCVMGMMVDVNALMSKPVLIFGGIYTALAVFAKILGCAIPSWCCGFNLLGGLRIGTGMVPRGEVALIIAGLGLSNGFLSQEIFGIGILMTLVTTVVAPPALVGLFIPKAKGVRHPRKTSEETTPMVFTLPEEQLAVIMAEKLVVEFTKEGFYSSRLAHDAYETMWNLSRDKMEIALNRKGTEIIVESTPEERAYIYQAWVEVVSQINELAKVITKPIPNKRAMTAMINESDRLSDANGSTLLRLMKNFVFVPQLKANAKRQAIEQLVDLVMEKNGNNPKDRDAILEAIFQREESMPTGLDRGIAVPHGRTGVIHEIEGAVAIVDNSGNENGTLADYETIDHSAVQIIVLTLAPLEGQNPYLQLMSGITSKLHCNDGHAKLPLCKTVEEMRSFFK